MKELNFMKEQEGLLKTLSNINDGVYLLTQLTGFIINYCRKETSS